MPFSKCDLSKSSQLSGTILFMTDEGFEKMLIMNTYIDMINIMIAQIGFDEYVLFRKIES